MFSPLDLHDDVSLEASRIQREPLRELLRLSLELDPMETAPREGIAFTAILLTGMRVTAERYEEEYFVCGTTGAPSKPVEASDFAGWLRGSEEKPEPYVLTEAQERAQYIADDMDADRNAGRGEDW